MSDNWSQCYESCNNYAQEINQKINEFKKLSNGSSQRAKMSSTIRRMISELDGDIQKLSSDLTTQSNNGVITTREANRRRTLVDTIKQSKEEIEAEMKECLNTFGPRERVDPRFASATETDQTQRLTNDDMTALRGNLRKGNDEAIDALHAIVKRQKEIGITMNHEVDSQNKLIDNITDKTGLLETRVKRQTALVKIVDRKSSTCCLWLIIVFLFIAIIVIAAVPFKKMIPSLVDLSVRVLGKYFLSIESCRYLPDEFVENIFQEYLKTISSLSIIDENSLTKIINLLTDYHSEVFCTSFCYTIANQLNFLSANFYCHLLKCVHVNLIQLDFSHALDKYNEEDKRRLLNIIGQMESIEYLRLTFNQLNDDDIRLLTASHRIRSKALCHLHILHLQGNHLTYRSARFLKALTSLDILYISLSSGQDKSIFVKEFDNLHECTCSTQNACEEIVNRGLISKIPQLKSSTIATNDSYFYRKRRRINDDNSVPITKLVRHCSTCHRISATSSTVKKDEKSSTTPKGFIDTTQANDLLLCYL